MCSVILPFITDGHPFHCDIERLRDQLGAVAVPLSSGRNVVSSEIRGRRLDGGGFALDRFYCSMQHWSDGVEGFDASSLYFDSRDTAPRCYRFPDEPYLVTLAPYLSSRGLDRPEGRLEVLRYVPLRRFTFRAPRHDCNSGYEIGKFKRRSRLHESYQRMTAVATAVQSTTAGFAVPAPAGVDPDHSIYFQDDVTGIDLATAAAGDRQVLELSAHVLAAFHSVTPPALPALDKESFHTGIARDLEWIGFHAPALGDLVDRAARALANPPPLESSVLAHGDFVPSHVLRHGDALTVIDLDLAHVGDRYREVAMMLASLPIDTPSVQPDTSAIIAAYEQRAGHRLEPRRLAWHRLAAEAYYLALAFSKDRPIDSLPLTTATDELEAA